MKIDIKPRPNGFQVYTQSRIQRLWVWDGWGLVPKDSSRSKCGTVIKLASEYLHQKTQKFNIFIQKFDLKRICWIEGKIRSLMHNLDNKTLVALNLKLGNKIGHVRYKIDNCGYASVIFNMPHEYHYFPFWWSKLYPIIKSMQIHCDQIASLNSLRVTLTK